MASVNNRAVDVFNRQVSTFGGSFSADDAIIVFPNIIATDVTTGAQTQTQANVPLLLQDFSVNYQQSTSMLYDLTTSNVYFVRGRAAGQGSMNQILGPARLSMAFLRTYGNVCRVDKNMMNIKMRAGCDSVGDAAQYAKSYDQSIICGMSLVDRLSFSGAAQNMLISQAVGFTFAYMSEQSPGAAPAR